MLRAGPGANLLGQDNTLPAEAVEQDCEGAAVRDGVEDHQDEADTQSQIVDARAPLFQV